MSYLEKATHLNNWIFNQEELSRVDELRSAKAKEYLRQLAASGKENESSLNRKPRSFACLVASGTLLKPNVEDPGDDLSLAVENGDAVASDTREYFTIEEERILRNFYEIKVQESCTILFRTSDKVKSSAVMLYKRFYLSNSVMEFHPKHVVPAVIYVAGKVEEQYINVDTICQHLQVDHRIVIAYEIIVLQGVRFQLIMYHPFRSLLGFIEDARLNNKVGNTKAALEALQKLHEHAVASINKMMLTNIPLLYNPSYIALAALRSVARTLTIEETNDLLIDMDLYLRKSKAIGHCTEQVVKILDEIEKRMEVETEPPSASIVKTLYKKLKSFHVEEKLTSNEGSKEPKKKKHKKEKKKKDKDKDKEKKN